MSETGDTPAWLTAGYDRIWMPYTQMQTAPLPQAAVATEGSRIKLSDGRELIDGVASWWAACHGYNHPHIVEAIRDQAARMPHIMLAGLANEPAFTLAQRFAAFAPDPDYRVFFSESGSVSVEVALKIAAQFWHNKGETTRKKFLCFRGGYHGDTFATMSLCDPVDGFHAAFQGVVPGQLIADLPENDATEAAVADDADDGIVRAGQLRADGHGQAPAQPRNAARREEARPRMARRQIGRDPDRSITGIRHVTDGAVADRGGDVAHDPLRPDGGRRRIDATFDGRITGLPVPGDFLLERRALIRPLAQPGHAQRRR